LAQQQECLLRVPYFLLTFTLPAGLRSLARSHQKDIYGLLFRASAAATQRLARDPRLLGGHIGMIGVLHTWARNLSYHPHIHYLVPGGAVSCDGQTWLPARGGFFLPVRPLGILFRAKFRDGLRKTGWFERVPAKVWRQAWVVHCQPVGNGLPALKYLARYVFRVALGNQRIQRVVDDRVTFSYQDGEQAARVPWLSESSSGVPAARSAQGMGQGPLLWLLQSRPAAMARATATTAGRLAGSRQPASHRVS
jgi:hypothetical protein